MKKIQGSLGFFMLELVDYVIFNYGVNNIELFLVGWVSTKLSESHSLVSRGVDSGEGKKIKLSLN